VLSSDTPFREAVANVPWHLLDVRAGTKDTGTRQLVLNGDSCVSGFEGHTHDLGGTFLTVIDGTTDRHNFGYAFLRAIRACQLNNRDAYWEIPRSGDERLGVRQRMMRVANGMANDVGNGA
jgi:hypothetical protein